jgi:nitrite reductase/ring-hydroxylating ferredoxin subunit
MQSFNTDGHEVHESTRTKQTIIVGRVDDLAPGQRATIELPNSQQLALFNVDGEFYATDNFCPHKGAPLAEGSLCGYVLECFWHGWQFDIRNGACLNVIEKIETYRVIIEDGLIKVEI